MYKFWNSLLLLGWFLFLLLHHRIRVSLQKNYNMYKYYAHIHKTDIVLVQHKLQWKTKHFLNSTMERREPKSSVSWIKGTEAMSTYMYEFGIIQSTIHIFLCNTTCCQNFNSTVHGLLCFYPIHTDKLKSVTNEFSSHESDNAWECDFNIAYCDHKYSQWLQSTLSTSTAAEEGYLFEGQVIPLCSFLAI